MWGGVENGGPALNQQCVYCMGIVQSLIVANREWREMNPSSRKGLGV